MIGSIDLVRGAIDVAFLNKKMEKEMNEVNKKLEESAKNNLAKAWQLNLFLANNPETAQEEYKASEKICDLLNESGIQAELGILDIPTAFFGKICQSSKNINIGILYEYDALPGLGHGCGHCASAAISYLSSLAIKENEGMIDANIFAIGTPGEEGAGMKIPMADKGFFDIFDFVIMVHMHSENRINCRFLAYETFDFTFTGKASHAAESPWEGDNAYNGMSLMIHAFDMMRQKLKDHSRIEGIVLEAGQAPNIIPDKAVCRYSFRAEDAGYLTNNFRSMVKDAAKGAALATQTEVSIKQVGNTYYDLIELKSAVEPMKGAYDDLGLEISSHKAFLGSSDIGNVSYRCPALHPTVSIGEKFNLHSKEFAKAMTNDKTKTAIFNGAMVILRYIGNYLADKELQENIKNEFNEMR